MREELVGAIGARLDGRELLWFGLRGEDAAPLLALPQFRHCYSLTAPLRMTGLQSNECLEELRSARVDLDTHDIDDDDGSGVAELRHSILAAMSQPSASGAYRPTRFFGAAEFASREHCLALGNFHEHQRLFDHKPWVETQLAARGVPTLDWEYIADEDRFAVVTQLADGPLVLRASRTNGGVGISLVTRPDVDLIDLNWPRRREAFVSVARYVDPAVPLNCSGVVARDGTVNLHPPSVQLIGVPTATDRRFGYCGNDFAAASDLDDAVLADATKVAKAAGRFLAEYRYVGAYGVDLLVDRAGRVSLTEINPRFQGSSLLSAQIAVQLGVPDLYLEHVAACLDLPLPEPASLRDWADRQPRVAQVVCHNLGGCSMRRAGAELPRERIDLLPEEHVTVLPGAVIGRMIYQRRVTDDGSNVDEAAAADVRLLASAFAT